MSDQPDLCCTHGEPILQRLDRLVELMEIVAETRKQPPVDGVYKVSIPAASRQWMYWEQRQRDAEREADERDGIPPTPPLVPLINDKIRAAADAAYAALTEANQQ